MKTERLTAAQHRQAAHILDQIEAMEAQLNRITGGKRYLNIMGAPKRKVSASTKAKMAAAARARWALHRKERKNLITTAR